jgi:hypothetical protein
LPFLRIISIGDKSEMTAMDPHFSSLFTAALLMPAIAFAGNMGEKDIRSDIIGGTVYVATPLGGELPLNYHTSGQVDGAGKAIGLGRFVKSSDSGKWWIKDDRLCQQFQTWFDGAPVCFELERTGDHRVRWTRDNGRKGMARIGE